MKQTFPINLVDGHLLISDNGNTIPVDTEAFANYYTGRAGSQIRVIII